MAHGDGDAKRGRAQLSLPVTHRGDHDELDLRAALEQLLARRLPCRGLLQLVCPRCEARRKVHFRCLRRCTVCPARVGRGGSTLARSLPRGVPVRHWTLALPSELRGRLHTDEALARRVGRTFMRAIFDELRRLSTTASGAAPRELECGGASLLHRLGRRLNLHPHLHAVVLDGVYAPDGTFVALPAGPDLAALRAVARKVRAELDRALGSPIGDPRPRPPASARQERATEPLGTPRKPVNAPERPSTPSPTPPARPSGVRVGVLGVDVHAAAAIDPEDRAAVFRLARYLSRPPFDPGAIEAQPNGRLRLRLDKPLADGTRHLEFSSAELAERLGALAPAQATSRVSFHGVLAPRAADRWRVVPTQLTLVESSPVPARPRAAPAAPTPADAHEVAKARSPAALLRCTCGTTMKVVAVEEEGTP